MKRPKFYLFVCCILLIVGCSKDPLGSDATFKDSRDKHVYKYVKIGTQTWMAENLAYLPAIILSTDGSETEPRYYVYDFDFEGGSVDVAKTKQNYSTYGVLYNWVAAKAACPSGWHLPTDAEWKLLETHLGMSQSNADSVGWRDSGAIGKALKFTSGWSKNGNGDNSSGFAGLPGGYHGITGLFDTLGNYALFWSASEGETSGSWGRFLGYDIDGVCRVDCIRGLGCSVRCLKN